VIQKEITMMLNAGIIQPSESPWCFPIVLAPKPDGKIRFCINFRRLNDVTVKDRFPLPRIDDCIDFLAGKSVFSTLDCFAGYWQVRLDPDSRRYCAFISPFGCFEFLVLPFGLTNAPAHFQRTMERMFAPFLHDFLSLYLDDLGIASGSFADHLVHLRKTFEVARLHQVRFKLSKCTFFASSFRYLGFLVTKEGLKPDPRKVSDLLARERPSNATGLRSFVCLASYFRRFIPHFADVVEPLQLLLKREAQFIWSSN
jgi:hypothetical protein